MMPVIRTKVRQLINEKSAELGRPLKLYEVSQGTGLQQSILRKYINDTIVNLNKPTLVKLMAYFEKTSISDILEIDLSDENPKKRYMIEMTEVGESAPTLTPEMRHKIAKEDFADALVKHLLGLGKEDGE